VEENITAILEMTKLSKKNRKKNWKNYWMNFACSMYVKTMAIH